MNVIRLFIIKEWFRIKKQSGMIKEEKDKIVELIRFYCFPSQYIYGYSSYGLKEAFEKLSRHYIHNDDFKDLMKEAGFHPTCRSKKDINHRYYLSVRVCDEIDPRFWGRGCDGALLRRIKKWYYDYIETGLRISRETYNKI